jgi:hypothetical protein
MTAKCNLSYFSENINIKLNKYIDGLNYVLLIVFYKKISLV